jgi:hypothetical protein
VGYPKEIPPKFNALGVALPESLVMASLLRNQAHVQMNFRFRVAHKNQIN